MKPSELYHRLTFRERLEQLKTEPRCIGAPNDRHNYIGGLLDLIADVKPRTVLEIGSNRGVSTEAFILTCEKVTAIDPWEQDPNDHNAAERGAEAEFTWRCSFYPNITVIKGKSPDAVLKLEDRFDLAYIDANHDYENVRADIIACKKVAKVIAGHDYADTKRRTITDVRRAVDEFGEVRIFDDTSWVLL